MYLVSVYLEDLAYGGPEEGGWYYNTGELVRTVKLFRSEERANDYCRRLNQKLRSREFGPNKDRRDISSVLSEGIYSADVHEDFAPRYYPERKPHYE